MQEDPISLPEVPTEQWYGETEPEGGRGKALWQHTRWIENKQQSHHRRILYNAKRYSNRELSAFDWGWGKFISPALTPANENMENLHMAVGETYVATVGKNRVKARPLTKNASFKLRRVARKLDRFLYAEAKRVDFWEKCKEAFRDAYWGEVGVLFGYYDKNGVVLERVFPDELIVDNNTCPSDLNPPMIIRRRAIHLESILKRFGKKLSAETVEKLRAEAKSDTPWLVDRPVAPGWLVVCEGYKPKSGTEKGCHVVGTYSTTIFEEVWEEEWVPFTYYHWMRPTSGFYCPSGVEHVDPYQKRLNKINAVIEDAQDLMARPRIWNQTGSKLQLSQMDSRIGRVLTSATEPKPLTWPAVSADLYNERERVKRECFGDLGLTQLAAQGKLPAGARLDSSEALNEYNAIQDDRLVDMAQRYERFQLETYNLLINLCEKAHSDGVKLKTTWAMGKRVEEIDWNDVDFSKDRYVIQIEPASVMSESTANRKEMVAKLAASGVFTREELLMQMNSPDLEREVAIQVAAMEDIERQAEIIEDGGYEAPSPLTDLVKGPQRMHYIALQLKTEYKDVPDKVITGFKRWIRQARWIAKTGADIEQANEQTGTGMPAVQGMPPQGAPGGMPMAPPGMPPAGPMPGGMPAGMPPGAVPGMPGM